MEDIESSEDQVLILKSDIIPNDLSLLKISKSLCKIDARKNNHPGFLIKFLKDKEDFFCLMTSIEQEMFKNMISIKEKLTFYYDNMEKIKKEIILNPEERYIKDFRDINIDVIIIQVLPKDNIPIKYFLLPNIDYLNNVNELINKDISIFPLQYQSDSSGPLFGKINNLKNYQLFHSINELKNSSGSPIFLKNSLEVIGINKCDYKNENFGYFIGPIFNYFKNFPEAKLIKEKSNNSSENKINKMTLIYLINKNDEKIRIFGENFVENNKNNCYLLIDGKQYVLCKDIKLNENQKNKDTIEIELIEKKNIINMSYMFENVFNPNSFLSSFSGNKSMFFKIINISEWDTKNVTDMSGMFYNCNSLESLPDISQWNTENVMNMSNMFYNCRMLKSLPDISKWNTKNLSNISNLFDNCNSLQSLPDISKWNVKNVIDMRYMFNECSSLISLPDISKWNVKNVIDMRYMFNECSSLISLPDISKWNIKNVTNISYMFYKCKSLISLSDLSKWDTNNVIDMSGLFKKCSTLISLPDISNWKTENVNDMSYMLSSCTTLVSLPDISKWDTKTVKNMEEMFNYCRALISLPDISKWDVKNVLNMKEMFHECISLRSFPDISKWNFNEGLEKKDMFKGCDQSIIPENLKESKCLIY